jgi:hypothetical protein
MARPEHKDPDVRREWIPPALRFVGTTGEVLQGGGGKLSVTGGDPGEGRKEKGSDK